MLNKLLPEQISKYWDVIKYAVEVSIPPIANGNNPNMLNKILTSTLCSKIDVWLSYTKGEVNKFEGLALTRILIDDASDTKNLLIYCLYGDNISGKAWTDGLLTLAKYAKSQNCFQIIAYSNIPYVIEVAKKLGGDTNYTFISFKVNEIVQKLNDINGG